MEVTLKIKDNLYTDPDESGRSKLIKKGCVTNLIVDTNDIITIGELINEKGKILKSYSRLHIKEAGPIVVNHSVDYIKKLKTPTLNKIGFKQKHK